MPAGLVLAIGCAALLFVAAMLVLLRIIRGPSVLDRTIASEVMVSILVCALGLEAALNRHSTTLAILVCLALLGFIGSVAVARFVALDHDRGRDLHPPDTHLTSDGAEAAGPAPRRGEHRV